jgi:pimeloyl-ACP methyl ester carboxylesterase
VLTEGPPPGLELHLVTASRSSRWRGPEAAARLAAAAQAPRVALHTVEAGHWLHVDNPGALLDVLHPAFE